ncbi:hypothetical protein D9757_012095 [Collybiopsis confluens]|uniref:F-box domain-containing protein n=1 Tax=Collybiopsis confluens TaxID=2823264 RepID=A0A8H5FXK0_9AGAR|nr:hypothetical protein D9757_012095 [Collybiopsis confluens]
MTWVNYPSTSFRPLPFDRANRGKPSRSPFPFFQLPVEVLNDVAPHIPPADLEALALVDRDCRQLARSVQFFYVKLTYSDVSLGMLETLLAEMMLGARKESSQTLASCIRHLALDLGYPLLTETRLSQFPILYSFFGKLPGAANAQNAYLHALAAVIRGSLPNLHSLEWQSRLKMNTELFRSITASTARHVMINHALFHSRLGVFEFYGRPKWALESLVLDVDCLSDSTEDAETIVKLMTDMLRAVSPTLQGLFWKGARLRAYVSFGWETVAFPRLRTLRLDAVPMADYSILTSFLSANTAISSLEVSSLDLATIEFLASRGNIESLECFSWIHQPDSHEEEILSFLECNSQLHKLSISQPLSPSTIESRILPTIKLDFLCLTSLQLVWDSSWIPETALSVIGTLFQLRRLWLSAGHQFGWCHSWLIDHDVILETLQPLYQLESLAFSRDSYKVVGHPLLDSSVENYYVNSVFPANKMFQKFLKPDERALLDSLDQNPDMSFDQARSLQIRLIKAAWERWHQEKMIDLAKVYATTFTKMKWCFIGQYPMRVDRESDTKMDIAVESASRQSNVGI